MYPPFGVQIRENKRHSTGYHRAYSYRYRTRHSGDPRLVERAAAILLLLIGVFLFIVGSRYLPQPTAMEEDVRDLVELLMRAADSAALASQDAVSSSWSSC